MADTSLSLDLSIHKLTRIFLRKTTNITPGVMNRTGLYNLTRKRKD